MYWFIGDPDGIDTGVGQNNGNTTSTVHIDLLIW
jgi:hypothetical protein